MDYEFITEENLVYLDDLRESGLTNMYGAVPYIEEELVLDRESSKILLLHWMKTFSQRHRSKE
jgi:hypothetical protein